MWELHSLEWLQWIHTHLEILKLIAAFFFPNCRILLDRAHTANDILLHQLDPEILSSPPHSPFNEFANTSQINTSDHPSRDLTQILANIKACRWQHFRPRSPNLQDNDGDELSSRKLYRGVNRIVTAQLGTQPCSTSVSSKSSGTGSTQNSGTCCDYSNSNLFNTNVIAMQFWGIMLYYAGKAMTGLNTTACKVFIGIFCSILNKVVYTNWLTIWKFEHVLCVAAHWKNHVYKNAGLILNWKFSCSL